MANLTRLFGLDAACAKLTVTANPRAVVIRGGMRRGVAKSAAAAVPLDELAPEDAWQLEGHEGWGGAHGDSGSESDGDEGAAAGGAMET